MTSKDTSRDLLLNADESKIKKIIFTGWHQTEVDAGVSILLSVTGSGLLESPLLAIRLFSFSFKHGAMGKQKLKTSNKSGATIISLYCRFTLRLC